MRNLTIPRISTPSIEILLFSLSLSSRTNLLAATGNVFLPSTKKPTRIGGGTNTAGT